VVEYISMSQDLLAEAEAIKKLLSDLKNSLETNTVDIDQVAIRIKQELSPQIISILTDATNSAEVIQQYGPLFILALDPNTVIFYLQPVVQQWLDLILNSIKNDCTTQS